MSQPALTDALAQTLGQKTPVKPQPTAASLLDIRPPGTPSFVSDRPQFWRSIQLRKNATQSAHPGKIRENIEFFDLA